MAQEDFVTYEQADQLGDIGFDWECDYLYDEDKELIKYDCFQNFYDEQLYSNCIPAPTLAQAQKWLREIKQIYLFVTMENSYYYWYIGKEFQIGNSKSYEEALSAGIDKAIEILNQYQDEILSRNNS